MEQFGELIDLTGIGVDSIKFERERNRKVTKHRLPFYFVYGLYMVESFDQLFSIIKDVAWNSDTCGVRGPQLKEIRSGALAIIIVTIRIRDYIRTFIINNNNNDDWFKIQITGFLLSILGQMPVCQIFLPT